MTDCRPGCRGGFTLIELVVIMAIILVLSGIAAVSLPRFRADALFNAATELQSALAVTRETAIAKRIPLSLTLDIAGNRVSFTGTGGQAATLQFRGSVGYPGYFGDGSLSCISAYMNYETNSGLRYGKDWYVSSTTNGTLMPRIWFDAFGRPNIQELPSGTPGLGSVACSHGFVTLETRGGASVVQVLIHMNTGETEVQWVKR
jgi:prepilin-type N-terminal cleavage/methylation domain-containing protein